MGSLPMQPVHIARGYVYSITTLIVAILIFDSLPVTCIKSAFFWEPGLPPSNKTGRNYIAEIIRSGIKHKDILPYRVVVSKWNS